MSRKKIELIDKGKLYEAYVVHQMSTTEIAKQSRKLFNRKVSASIVYAHMKVHGIPFRTKSESVSLATCILDRNKLFMTEDLLEWTDGFLLGDGGINFKNHKRHMGSRFHFGSVHKEWTQYAMSGFSSYKPSEPRQYGKIRLKSPRLCWSSRTLTHPDIVEQAKRWYPEKHKEVPDDVRITPTSVLLWYLGDGSICHREKTTVLRLATCSFSPMSIDGILVEKLKDLGIDCYRTKCKNDIKIRSKSIGRFFEFIGRKSPISCYDYKFDVPDWLFLYRLSDFITDKKAKYRAQYYIKHAKADCTRSPGGKIALFTSRQAIAMCRKVGVECVIKQIGCDSLPITLSDTTHGSIEAFNARWFANHGLITITKGKLSVADAETLRKLLDKNGNRWAVPDVLVKKEFAKARSQGFPFYNLSEDRKGVICRNLKDSDCNLMTWDGYGTELASSFHPHIFECRKKGKLSPIEFFNSDVDLERGMRKLLSLYGHVTPSHLREICRNESSSSRINNFPPRVAMKIIKRLFPHVQTGSFLSVLDPCAGFSGRLFGAFCSGMVRRYVGVDLSVLTVTGLQKTRNWLRRFNDAVGIELIHDNCLNYMSSYTLEKFDLILTSPPFFDVEQYVGVGVETNYDEWKKNFVIPFIRNGFRCLQDGGLLALYLEKVGKFDLPKDFTELANENGFVLCQPITFKMTCGEYNRSSGTKRSIEILVFERVK